MPERLPSYSAYISADELLNELYGKKLIDCDDSIIDFLTQHQHSKRPPFYLNFLIGLGAFIASVCFISVIVIGFAIRSDEGFIIFGFIFCVLAILLQKIVEGSDVGVVKNSFFSQSLFYFMMSGKVLLCFGMASMFDFSWGLSITLLLVTASTYFLYPVSIDRFIWCTAFFISLFVNILWQRDFVGYRELIFNGLILFYAVSAVLLMTNIKMKFDYAPLLYSLLFSLCISVLFLASHNKFGYWHNEEVVGVLFATWLFAGCLIFAIHGIAKGSSKPKNEALVLAYLGVFLFPVFLILYYYNLDISLMDKSIVLISSGLALLAGRFYISFKGWDKEIFA